MLRFPSVDVVPRRRRPRAGLLDGHGDAGAVDRRREEFGCESRRHRAVVGGRRRRLPRDRSRPSRLHGPTATPARKPPVTSGPPSSAGWRKPKRSAELCRTAAGAADRLIRPAVDAPSATGRLTRGPDPSRRGFNLLMMLRQFSHHRETPNPVIARSKATKQSMPPLASCGKNRSVFCSQRRAAGRPEGATAAQRPWIASPGLFDPGVARDDGAVRCRLGSYTIASLRHRSRRAASRAKGAPAVATAENSAVDP